MDSPIYIIFILVALGLIYESMGFIGTVLGLAGIVLFYAFIVMGGAHVLMAVLWGLIVLGALSAVMEESAKRGAKEILQDIMKTFIVCPGWGFALVVCAVLYALFIWGLVSVSNGWDMLAGTVAGAGMAGWCFMRTKLKPKRQPASNTGSR